MTLVLVHGGWHGGWCWRDYVRCTEGPLVPTFAPFADRAKSDPGWDHHELAAGHDAMLLAAGAVAAALLVGGGAAP